MTLLARLRRRTVPSAAPAGEVGEERQASDYAFDPVLQAMAAADDAASDLLGLPAVEASIALISGVLASLPIVVQQPAEDGRLVPVPGHSVTRLMAAPSPWLTSFELVERLVADVLAEGNAYARIIRDGRGAPAALVYYANGSVYPERVPRAATVIYRISDPDTGQSFTILDEDVLHIRFRLSPRDRLHGISPVKQSARTLRLAAAADNYATTIYRNRGVPSGFLTVGKALGDRAKERLKKAFDGFWGQSNAGKLAVLEEGMNYIPASTTPRDAQMTEVSEALTASVARVFWVPPALIGSAGALNYSAMTQVVSNWVRLGLRPWMIRVEQALEDKLLSADAKSNWLVIRFDVSALTRLDDAERSKLLQTLLTAGVITPNEARQREGLPKIAGADKLSTVPGAGLLPGPGAPAGTGSLISGEPSTGSAPGGAGP